MNCKVDNGNNEVRIFTFRFPLLSQFLYIYFFHLEEKLPFRPRFLSDNEDENHDRTVAILMSKFSDSFPKGGLQVRKKEGDKVNSAYRHMFKMRLL